MKGNAVLSTQALQQIHFAPERLLLPVIVCLWVLCFVTFSPPDDWRVSRFGTAPILPPFVLTLMKLFGRGGALALMSFGLLSVWRYEKRPHAIAMMAPLLMFSFYGVFSTCWSALKSTSLQQSVTFMMVIVLATYISVIWRSDRDTERIIKHLALAIFVLSNLLLVLHFVMPRSGSLTKESAGILHSTNACASAGLGILLTMAARLIWKSPWSMWWFPIVSIECGMMLLAGNRLSVVVTAIVVLLLMAIAMHRAAAGILLLAVAILVGGYFVCDPGLSGVENVGKQVGVFAKQGQSKSELNSVSGRAEMWEKMWRSYYKSPLIGHGFFVSTQKGRIYVWHEWGNWTAHNVLLQTLVTLGAIGLGMLIVGLLWLAAGVVSGLKYLEDVNKSVLLLALASIWYFGWGFLNESFIGPLTPEVVVFAVLVGVAAGIGGSARWLAYQGAATLGRN